jgi:thiamine-phosphate pyrophosphorylase
LRSTLVQIITDLAAVPETDLLARIDRAGRLPPEARGRLSVQLRDPQLPARALHRLGVALRRATSAIGAKLVVNDRVDLALLLEADGVHLGRRSMSVEEARSLLGPGAWVSTSAHAVEDVLAAARAGANAALLSPIFASPGKGAPVGPEALGEARRALERGGLSLHLFALGGVTAENADLCVAAGADGVAAIRADLTSALGTG